MQPSINFFIIVSDKSLYPNFIALSEVSQAFFIVSDRISKILSAYHTALALSDTNNCAFFISITLNLYTFILE